MNYNDEKIRQEQLLRCVPDIYDFQDCLYIGAHFHFGRNIQCGRLFKDIEIVEVFHENVKQLRAAGFTVHHSDIMAFAPERCYDVSMFWHGPEHLTKEQFPVLLEKLKKCTLNLIVFATPFGHYEQGPEYGNKHEKHLSDWRAEDFEMYGLEADEMGTEYNGNVIAWLRL